MVYDDLSTHHKDSIMLLWCINGDLYSLSAFRLNVLLLRYMCSVINAPVVAVKLSTMQHFHLQVYTF